MEYDIYLRELNSVALEAEKMCSESLYMFLGVTTPTPVMESFGSKIADLIDKFLRLLRRIRDAVVNWVKGFRNKAGKRNYAMEPLIIRAATDTRSKIADLMHNPDQMFSSNVDFGENIWSKCKTELRQKLIANSTDKFYKRIPVNPVVDDVLKCIDEFEARFKQIMNLNDEALAEQKINREAVAANIAAISRLAALIMTCLDMTTYENREKYLSVDVSNVTASR